ncbi:hypothetical protein PAECIP111890_02519 [Paenibacillus sp. JJ-223]|nr:hypothetical protein PAECIP111890_02519 [Paenibacillus sp. JJ-223]
MDPVSREAGSILIYMLPHRLRNQFQNPVLFFIGKTWNCDIPQCIMKRE